MPLDSLTTIVVHPSGFAIYAPGGVLLSVHKTVEKAQEARLAHELRLQA